MVAQCKVALNCFLIPIADALGLPRHASYLEDTLRRYLQCRASA